MNLTDPIADMLTRIRNAQTARHATTRIPGSKIKLELAKLLKEEGYISEAGWLDEGPQGWIMVTLKYAANGEPVIRGIRRESKPGQRTYVQMKDIPEVLNGLGISILSTSKGLVTGRSAKEASTGGELLATVW
jgi:small subunit ribosomal protein S8